MSWSVSRRRDPRTAKKMMRSKLPDGASRIIIEHVGVLDACHAELLVRHGCLAVLCSDVVVGFRRRTGRTT
jgi:hypothetical protein